MHQKLAQNTAILFFANSAEMDCYVKKVEGGKSIFDALTQRTLATVKATELPFYHLGESEQFGKNFGERFSNAIQQIFNLGYARVITIGNDSPQLTSKLILKAEAQLLQQKTVLGPSLDGGFYLMGIHRSDFDKKAFETLPWQSAHLYQKISVYFKSLECEIHELKKLLDVDSVFDIKLLSNYIKGLGKKWISLLTEVLVSKSSFYLSIESSLQSTYLPVGFNKGSPVSLL